MTFSAVVPTTSCFEICCFHDLYFYINNNAVINRMVKIVTIPQVLNFSAFVSMILIVK